MNWQPLDARALRAWPLPALRADADKEERGRALVIGGSREIGGAAQLAAIAALRAGAGKLVIATAESACAALAQAVPEARVIGLREVESGAFAADAAQPLAKPIAGAAAVLVGPGMMDPAGNIDFVARVLQEARAPLILDACAMDLVTRVGRFTQPPLLTPHAGEMAHLLGIEKAAVEADPRTVVAQAARRWNAVVALKGAATHIATPDGRGWIHAAGHPGLATSGSGDVLAGLVLGFAARGAPLEQACAWGVVLHSLAGDALARRLGPLGFLARELAGVVPSLLKKVEGRVRRRAQAAG